MIKILHLVSIMNRGGIETFLMNVMRRIDQSRCRFSFLCLLPGEGDYDSEIEMLGGKVFHLSTDSSLGVTTGKLSRFCSVYKWLKNNQNEYDIVHLHISRPLAMLSYVTAARLNGVKKIIVHSHNSAGTNSFINTLARSMANHYKFIRFACSKEAGKWMFGNKKFDIINNAIDLDRAAYNNENRSRLRKQLGVENNYVIGCVGRLTEQKNHAFLIDVFYKYSQSHSDAVLLLIGRGELEQDIRAQIDRLGLVDKVYMLGVRADVLELYSAMDCFAFPSLYEGLSLVSLEVQAARLPLIVNNTFPIIMFDEYVECIPLDIAQWCNAIDRVRAVDRNAIIFNEHYAEYDIDSVAATLEKKYASIMDEKTC